MSTLSALWGSKQGKGKWLWLLKLGALSLPRSSGRWYWGGLSEAGVRKKGLYAKTPRREGFYTAHCSQFTVSKAGGRDKSREGVRATNDSRLPPCGIRLATNALRLAV